MALNPLFYFVLFTVSYIACFRTLFGLMGALFINVGMAFSYLVLRKMMVTLWSLVISRLDCPFVLQKCLFCYPLSCPNFARKDSGVWWLSTRVVQFSVMTILSWEITNNCHLGEIRTSWETK